MLKNFTLIIALLLTSLAQAQKETSIRHIDILAYDSDGGLYFYAQKQKDKFSELEFDAQEVSKVSSSLFSVGVSVFFTLSSNIATCFS